MYDIPHNFIHILLRFPTHPTHIHFQLSGSPLRLIKKLLKYYVAIFLNFVLQTQQC